MLLQLGSLWYLEPLWGIHTITSPGASVASGVGSGAGSGVSVGVGSGIGSTVGSGVGSAIGSGMAVASCVGAVLCIGASSFSIALPTAPITTNATIAQNHQRL